MFKQHHTQSLLSASLLMLMMLVLVLQLCPCENNFHVLYPKPQAEPLSLCSCQHHQDAKQESKHEEESPREHHCHHTPATFSLLINKVKIPQEIVLELASHLPLLAARLEHEARAKAHFSEAIPPLHSPFDAVRRPLLI